MKEKKFIGYSMFWGLLIFAALAAACGNGKTGNDSSLKNNAPSNSNSSSSSNMSNTVNTTNMTDPSANTDSGKVTLLTGDNDEKIKPDDTAKLENGKAIPGLLFLDLTLPAGWKSKRTTSGYDFAPPKLVEGEVAGAYFMLTLKNESEYPVNDKRAMLELELTQTKKDKDSGKLQYAGTLGIMSENNGMIIGVATVSDNPLPEAKPNAKCSLENSQNCGRYTWSGYGGGEYHDDYYIAILFPPGTYEKNKPMIDAIIKSVRFH